MMDGEVGRGPIARESDSIFGPRITVSALLGSDPADALAAYDRPARAALAAMTRWISRFLTSEHADLGRRGAVCPFTRPAIDHDLIRLTACSLSDEPSIRAGVALLRGELADLKGWPGAGSGQKHRAIVAVFPRLAEPHGAQMIERIQKALKPSFVRGRLMIGQFYPSCPEPGLWNPDFQPLQSPVISLAMRNITILDAPFMLDRAEYIEAFVGAFGTAGKDMIAKAARARGCPAARKGAL